MRTLITYPWHDIEVTPWALERATEKLMQGERRYARRLLTDYEGWRETHTTTRLDLNFYTTLLCQAKGGDQGYTDDCEY